MSSANHHPAHRSVIESPFAIEAIRKFLRGYFRLFHATRATGRENLPASGPALFASNHQSYYDPLLVAAQQDAPIRYMAWEAIFKYDWFAHLISSYGAFPVDPDGKDPGGFRTCLDLLDQGERIIIFPEGCRSYDDHLMPLREGVARLAIRTGAPIIPVRITGGDKAWPRGDFAPRPLFPVHVHYGEPITPRSARSADERHAESKRLMGQIRAAIDPQALLTKP